MLLRRWTHLVWTPFSKASWAPGHLLSLTRELSGPVDARAHVELGAGQVDDLKATGVHAQRDVDARLLKH